MLFEYVYRAQEDDDCIKKLTFDNDKEQLDAHKMALNRWYLKKCQLSESNFEAAEFIDVTFNGCDFSNACFKNTNSIS